MKPNLRWDDVLLLLLLLPAVAFAQNAADAAADSGGMTLPQFRSAVEARLNEAAQAATRSREKLPPPDLRLTDEAFLQLLEVQARQAAAQQSLDRLSGWSKAIQVRFEAQNAPELDVGTIRFAEARMAAESARFERQRQQAVASANALLGRAANSPLSGLLPPTADASNGGDRLKAESDLLVQGRELLAKMYQSYSFGGTSLSALLWQEQELYRAETVYRIGMARDAVAPGR